MTVDVPCPHCGFVNKVQPTGLPQTVLCDVDEGGCDKHFVAQVTTTVTHDVKVAPIFWRNASQ